MAQKRNKNAMYTLLMTVPLLFVGCGNKNSHERDSVVQYVSENTIMAKDVNTGEEKLFEIGYDMVFSRYTDNGKKRNIDKSDLQYIQPNDTLTLLGYTVKQYKNTSVFTVNNGLLFANKDSLRARHQRQLLQEKVQNLSR